MKTFGKISTLFLALPLLALFVGCGFDEDDAIEDGTEEITHEDGDHDGHSHEDEPGNQDPMASELNRMREGEIGSAIFEANSMDVVALTSAMKKHESMYSCKKDGNPYFVVTSAKHVENSRMDIDQPEKMNGEFLCTLESIKEED